MEERRERLADALRQRGVPATVAAAAGAALAAFREAAGPDDRLLVTGSHGTVAEVLRADAETRAAAPNPERDAG